MKKKIVSQPKLENMTFETIHTACFQCSASEQAQTVKRLQYISRINKG